jgi:hypothetical protein
VRRDAARLNRNVRGFRKPLSLAPSIRRRSGCLSAPGEPAGSANIGLEVAFWGLKGDFARSGEPGLAAELGVALLACGYARWLFIRSSWPFAAGHVSGNRGLSSARLGACQAIFSSPGRILQSG